MKKFEIEHFLRPEDGRDVFLAWLQGLRDMRAKVAVIRRVARMEIGNFGDHKFCRDGVFELRVDIGPGYRVYYALSGDQVVLLFSGGTKGTQAADIERACAYWKIFQELR